MNKYLSWGQGYIVKSPKQVDLDAFEEMTVSLIMEAKKYGLAGTRIRDLQDTKVVIRAIRKCREKML